MIFLLILAVFVSASCSGFRSADANAANLGEGGPLPIGSEYTNAAAALDDGTRLLDTGETEHAIDVLLQAVKLDPNLAEAWFKLGIAYSLVEADVDSAQGAEESPTPETGTKKPAEKKKNSEKAFESAVDAYKKLIAANAEDDNAHYYLGLTYNKLNEDDDAARSIREAIRLKPDNVEYQVSLGNVLMKLAKFAEAERAFKKAIELEPGNIEAEELLERAEAGRKRVEFNPPPKDDKSGSSNSSNSNANTNTAAPPEKQPTPSANRTARPSNSQPRSTPRPARSPN
ncbi:MAG: tetratricopeptide repeat protein [Chloracidobacterium sp.]|nr:tetratricopeptide repeat protein [Chloracidobacterium sp.]